MWSIDSVNGGAVRLYVSADARYQTVYTYHQTADNPGVRQWSLNWQIGRAVPEGTKGVR